MTEIIKNPNLSSVKRKILVALITVDVHNRDIVEKLLNETVMSTEDFIWQQQLRYYSKERENTGDNNPNNQVKESVIV